MALGCHNRATAFASAEDLCPEMWQYIEVKHMHYNQANDVRTVILRAQ